LTAYLLSASVLTPLLGRLGDRHGKHRVLVLSLVIFGVGALVAAVSRTLEGLIAGRVLQGAGGAVFPLAFGIVREHASRRQASMSIALLSALLGVGGGLGVVLAGPIVERLGYRALFWLALPLIVLAIAMTALFVPASRAHRTGRINWAGAALLAGWLVTGLLGITQGPDWGWGSPRVLALFAACAGLITAWAISESRAAVPMIDMDLLRRRDLWPLHVAAVALGGAMYTTFLLIPQFVEAPSASGYGFDASVATGGLYLLPLTLVMLAVSPIAGELVHRHHARGVLMAGLPLTGGGYALLAFAHDRPLEILLASAVLGLGIGLAFASLASLVVDAVAGEQTAVATGMNTVMRTIGGSIGNAVAASILAASAVSATGLLREWGFTAAFLAGAGSCVVALAVVAWAGAGLRRAT
jgi:MFS family permease